MIDLKTVKNITIAEGSVTKITDSSGVVLWEVKSTSEQTPCYYVADNVSDLPSTPKYDMAYITSEKCWYALNNKSKWEKYGVIELVSSLDNVTAYDGKLVHNTTDKHQYKYTGGAWSDQGEVKVSTKVASLPSSFGFNYNAKNFDETTQTLKNDSGASVATDVVLRTGYNDSDSLTNYKIIGNDHITINSNIFGIIKGYHDYINRSSSNPTLTIIAKVSTSNGFSVFANRTIRSAYNYMFRVYESYLTLHGSSEQGQIAISKKPSIIGLTVDSSRTLTYFNKTDNLTSTYQNFNYGSINNGDSVLFEGYGDDVLEPWRGDFYWIFMSNQTLTENEIEDVINYNENGVEYVYPVSYEQYDAPNLNYTECANESAMKTLSCPYEGMIVKLTDTGKKYKFTYNSTTSQYEWDEITSSLDVDLNNQWIVSTKTLEGYKVYMSNSNHNVDNSYASMKFKFEGMPDFKIWINSYAESKYDYTIAWDIDVDFPTSNPSNSLPGAKASTNGKQYNPNSITAFTEVDYPNDGGEHFVVVTYRKDYSANSNDDRGYVAVK